MLRKVRRASSFVGLLGIREQACEKYKWELAVVVREACRLWCWSDIPIKGRGGAGQELDWAGKGSDHDSRGDSLGQANTELQDTDCLLEVSQAGQKWPGPAIIHMLSLVGSFRRRARLCSEAKADPGDHPWRVSPLCPHHREMGNLFLKGHPSITSTLPQRGCGEYRKRAIQPLRKGDYSLGEEDGQ